MHRVILLINVYLTNYLKRLFILKQTKYQINKYFTCLENAIYLGHRQQSSDARVINNK